MRQKEVQIGKTYTAKVTGKLTSVRIDAENRYGGWDATNLTTGKKIRIKSPQRLRAASPATQGKAAATNKQRDEAATIAPKTPTAANGGKTQAKAAKDAKPRKVATRAKRGEAKAKRLSGLDAAARVLAESAEAMNVKQIIAIAFEKGYWKSDGRTPHATIYSAIIREIATKGDDARFERGKRRGTFRARCTPQQTERLTSEKQ